MSRYNNCESSTSVRVISSMAQPGLHSYLYYTKGKGKFPTTSDREKSRKAGCPPLCYALASPHDGLFEHSLRLSNEAQANSESVAECCKHRDELKIIYNDLRHVVSRAVSKYFVPPAAVEGVPSDNSDEDATESEEDNAESEIYDLKLTERFKPKVTSATSPFRLSLFPYVPPYLNFCWRTETMDTFPKQLGEALRWKYNNTTPQIVKTIIRHSGFKLYLAQPGWVGYWGQNLSAEEYKGLELYQKVNQLPGTYHLGRKDCLWANLNKLIKRHGQNNFEFVPKTFVYPRDKNSLISFRSLPGRKRVPWIIKPPAQSCGVGIRIIDNLNRLKLTTESVIVQQYIANPYIIRGRKFDLRIYILATSFNPLRVYIYKEGLVRFATREYSTHPENYQDKFRHLTNYSINKRCEQYKTNHSLHDRKGDKWSLASLWKQLEEDGVDSKTVIDSIEDLVIKTLIAGEEDIVRCADDMPCRYNGYQLFGFDIILDENVNPWILEVNSNPSVQNYSKLDRDIKAPMVTEILNIVGVHLPPNLHNQFALSFRKFDKQETLAFDSRIYMKSLTNSDREKQVKLRRDYEHTSDKIQEILLELTTGDLRQLITAEDELNCCVDFRRIFPGPESHHYLPMFPQRRYYDCLLDAWTTAFQGGEKHQGIEILQKLCKNKIHLKAPGGIPFRIHYEYMAAAIDRIEQEEKVEKCLEEKCRAFDAAIGPGLSPQMRKYRC